MRISYWSSDVCSSDLAIYRAADIFRLTQSGEAGRPITIKGQVRDGEYLTIVRGGCLEETRRGVSGEPPPKDQLPPCPPFGVPGEAMATIAAANDTEPEEASGGATLAKPGDSFLERSEEHTSELQSLMR